jgi:hypothetical protein
MKPRRDDDEQQEGVDPDFDDETAHATPFSRPWTGDGIAVRSRHCPVPGRVVVMHDDTPESRRQSPKAEPTPPPTEAELSRIARQAVHQPPDARLDKQLVRMGLMDAPELAEPLPALPTSRPVEIDQELVRLREELRRLKVIIWLLVGVIAILAVVVIVLLIS